jgi:hypothetical protein
MEKKNLQIFKESSLTKEFFEVLNKYRETLKETAVAGYEAGKSVSRDDIANDIIYLNGYTQCLQDIINIDSEVINDIINQYKEEVRPIFDTYREPEFIGQNDSGEADKIS